MSVVERVSAPVRIDVSVNWPDCDPYRQEFGGYILNAAIQQRVSTRIADGEFILSLGDIPGNSGLGTSAAIRTTFVVASNPSIIQRHTLSEQIYKIYNFENNVLNHRAGLQDQAAALTGGVNLWEFKSNNAIKRESIPIERAQHLEDRLALIYTGEKHESGDMLDIAFDPQNYDRLIPNFDRMSRLAQQMALSIDDESAMSDLINEARELHRAPFDGVETDMMRDIAVKLKGDYLAWKATGAGGGGCIFFYTSDKEALAEHFDQLHERGNIPESVQIFPVRFDYEGLKVE